MEEHEKCIYFNECGVRRNAVGRERKKDIRCSKEDSKTCSAKRHFDKQNETINS